MRPLLLVSIFLFSFVAHKAQKYGNEWIRFSQQYHKIPIAKAGVYRLDSLTLSKYYTLGSLNPINFQVFIKGQEQFLYIKGEGDGVFNSYWLYTIILSSRFDGRRDELLEFLKDSGIEARPVFYPVHLMPPYQRYNSDGTNFPISNMASERGVSLPSSIGITEAEVNRVCSVLRMFVDRA